MKAAAGGRAGRSTSATLLPLAMELYYKEYGSGPPLVILHGLLGSGGNWHTLASRAFGEHFTVYAVDQRNHGRSPHTDEMSYEAMAADLAAFLDAQSIGQTHLIGHSMGGKTAMHFALAYPERVDRLVVVDMAPRAYEPGHTTILDALSAVDPSAYASRREVDDALARKIASPAVRQFLLKNLGLDADERRYYWQMNLDGIVRSYDALNEAVPPGRTFDGPARFVRGSASGYVTDDDLGAIRALFPQSDVVTLDAGHWVHADAPEDFARVVTEFLEEGAEDREA